MIITSLLEADLRYRAKLNRRIFKYHSITMQLAGYKIGALLGDGGMASVHKGLQLSLQRSVAVKILKNALIHHNKIRECFLRESLIIARLHHPNIIHVIDQGILEDGRPYFIMEYCKSITLHTALGKNSLNLPRALDIFTQIAKALAYAHKNGVIHCDIKPENILIDFEGIVRVLDFGIAQLYKDMQQASDDDNDFIMGTANYMAPEQEQGASHASEKSDIYSLGVIMYLFATQQIPNHKPVSPITINPSIPKIFSDLILQCLAQNPNDRPINADVVKNTLLNILQGRHLNDVQRRRASIDVKKTFKLLDVLKENEHGAVYLFQEQESHTMYVVKKKNNNYPGYDTAKKMVAIDHPNTLRLFGTSRNDRAFILVMEYCSGDTLASRLVKTFTDEQFYSIARQVLSGLLAAYESGVIHGNLRPSNILFDENNRVKISDFGFDEHYGASEENWYAIPSEGKSEVADIYALGVIFYQMLTCDVPHWKDDRLVRAASFTARPEPLQLLVRKMLVKNPAKRIRYVKNVLKQLELFFANNATCVREQFPMCEMPQCDEVSMKKDASKARAILLIILFGVLLGAQLYLAYTGRLTSLLMTIQ